MNYFVLLYISIGYGTFEGITPTMYNEHSVNQVALLLIWSGDLFYIMWPQIYRGVLFCDQPLRHTLFFVITLFDTQYMMATDYITVVIYT